jgi:biopolymer transport protein ExbB/TolQ
VVVVVVFVILLLFIFGLVLVLVLVLRCVSVFLFQNDQVVMVTSSKWPNNSLVKSTKYVCGKDFLLGLPALFFHFSPKAVKSQSS